MRRMIYLAALLSTTALYPSPASAMPPVLGFVGGIVSAIGAPALGGAIAGTAGLASSAFITGASVGFGITGALGGSLLGFIGSAALSVGLSVLAGMLRTKPQNASASPASAGARMVNMRQPISDMEVVYGRVRKGGPVSFWRGYAGARYYDVLFAAHPINAFIQFQADERALSLSGINVTTSPYSTYSALQIEAFTGIANTRPTLLGGAFSDVTTAHDWAGLAHATVKASNVDAEHFSEVYPGSREPVITSILEGKLVYDPRSGAVAYSNNAALIIADWIVSTDGLDREVDWNAVKVEADICDQLVTNRSGGTQKRWTLNGTYSLTTAREDVRAQVGVAADAFFFERMDGKVGFYVGRYIAPTVTITDRPGNDKPSHIIAATYTQGFDGTDQINAQSIVYVEPAQSYVETPSAPISISAPDEPYFEDSKTVLWINSHNQACRISKRLLDLARAEWKASLTLNLQGARLQEQRFFRLVHEEIGLDLTMEVDKLARNEDGMTFQVECHSVNEADFNFNASTEEGQAPIRSTSAGSSTVPSVTGLSATGISGGLSIVFDAPGRGGLITQIRVRQESGPGDWQKFSVPTGQTTYTIAGLPTAAHNVQARNVTSSGASSAWGPVDGSGNPTLTVTPGTSVPPADPPSSFTAVGGSGSVTRTWTTANDPDVAGTIFRRNTINDESSATLVGGIVYSGPNTTLSRTDTGLPAGTYYYFARGVNSTGSESSTARASGAVTVT